MTVPFVSTPNFKFIHIAGLSTKILVILGANSKISWKWSRLQRCKASTQKQVSQSLSIKNHIFLSDNAVSMVKRYLIGLLEWANKQPTHKVKKSKIQRRFFKHTQTCWFPRFSNMSALRNGLNLAARSCQASAHQVLIIENHIKPNSREKLQKCNVCDFASIRISYLRNQMNSVILKY